MYDLIQKIAGGFGRTVAIRYDGGSVRQIQQFLIVKFNYDPVCVFACFLAPWLVFAAPIKGERHISYATVCQLP